MLLGWWKRPHGTAVIVRYGSCSATSPQDTQLGPRPAGTCQPGMTWSVLIISNSRRPASNRKFWVNSSIRMGVSPALQVGGRASLGAAANCAAYATYRHRVAWAPSSSPVKASSPHWPSAAWGVGTRLSDVEAATGPEGDVAHGDDRAGQAGALPSRGRHDAGPLGRGDCTAAVLREAAHSGWPGGHRGNAGFRSRWSATRICGTHRRTGPRAGGRTPSIMRVTPPGGRSGWPAQGSTDVVGACVLTNLRRTIRTACCMAQ